MTTRKPVGYPCHVDDDLAHIATVDLKRDTGVVRAIDLEPRPCTRRHKPAPQGASSTDLRKAGLAPRTAVRLLDPTTTRDQRAAMDDPPKAKRPPSSPTSSARPKGKRARERRSYSEEDRRVALELVEAAGIAAAHGSTGIPKATLSRWAKAAGIELDEQVRARTRAAASAAEAKAAEVRVTTVDRLERILDDQLATLEALGQLERRALEAALNVDPEHAVMVRSGARVGELILHGIAPELAQALGLAELVSSSVVKRDVVGAATRAVHDLQLLKGDATERGAIVVRFGIPRPNAADADAQAVDEADLSGGAP